MPPKQDDLAARMDPTKQRPRTFNTSKGAKGPSALGEDSSSWNETPEQRQKRLADEMMGVSKPSTTVPKGPAKAQNGAKEDPDAKKIRDRTVCIFLTSDLLDDPRLTIYLQEQARGPSLLEQHKGSKGAEAEDDPSKRSFDREKDMSTGMRIGHAQRQEMLNKASNFSSKFSGGSYL